VQDKHVVVTGAGRGIGKAIAVRLARDGARLSLLARGEEALEQTAAEIGGAFVRAVDIRDGAKVDAAFAAAADANGPIHALVANSGSGGPNEPGDGDRFFDLVQTNLGGT
jgi:NAD(P)-dependent dehydrogenase (short-subunit alcohol dehydrogenase family)